MLQKIQNFFESHFMSEEQQPSMEHQLHMATAALLIEMILQDHEVSETEVLHVKKVLMDVLDLSKVDVEDIYMLAEEERKQATDFHQFTKLISQHYSQPQKIELIESLWRIAYADDVIHKYEEHMLRRVCDLIYVSHKDFIQAKHRVEAEHKKTSS